MTTDLTELVNHALETAMECNHPDLVKSLLEKGGIPTKEGIGSVLKQSDPKSILMHLHAYNKLPTNIVELAISAENWEIIGLLLRLNYAFTSHDVLRLTSKGRKELVERCLDILAIKTEKARKV